MVYEIQKRGAIIKQEVNGQTLLERRTLAKWFKLILNRKDCNGCGICVEKCPKEAIEFSQNRSGEVRTLMQEPIDFIPEKCVLCGKCVTVCPTDAIHMVIEGEEKIPVVDANVFATETKEEYKYLEDFIFGKGRNPEETFGIYKDIVVARSKDGEVLKKCQDGGVVTTLLIAALKSGMIDGAIVSGVDPTKPWQPVPVAVATCDDIIASAGIRYSFSPSFLAVSDGVTNGLKKIALVGTSCQILAVRRIQKNAEYEELKKYANSILFNVGIFCKSSFTYEGFMIGKIKEEMGIDLNQVSKINIKANITVYLKNGEKREIPLKEVYQYAPFKCRYCRDFASELADVSVGALALEGWNIVLIRTDKGEKLFQNAVNMGLLETKPIEMSELPVRLLVKLTKIKRAQS